MDFPWRDAFRGFQEHGGCFSDHRKKHFSGQITRRSTENRCALPEIIAKHVFFQKKKKAGRAFQKFAKKHGVVSGRIGLFILACFHATIFSGVASAHFRLLQFGVQIVFHLAGLVGNKKESVAACFRVNIISNDFQCVFVLFVVLTFSLLVWSLLRVKEVKNLTVCILTFFFFDGCCVGTNSGHNPCFQTIFHAACLVGTQNKLLRQAANMVNPALPSIPPSCLHRTRRKLVFDDLRKCQSVFLELESCFSEVSGRALACILI